MRLSVKTQGAGSAVLFIQKTLRAKVFNSVNEMNLIVEEILEIAREIAPRKSGDLRGTGTTSKADFGSAYEVHVAAVIFGGEDAPYAKYHENWYRPVYKSPTTPGTAPYFIERALIKFGGHEEVRRRLRNAVRRV